MKYTMASRPAEAMWTGREMSCQGQDQHSAQRRRGNRVIDQGYQPAQEGNLMAPDKAGAVNLVSGGEKPGGQPAQQVADHAAQGIHHEVVHIKQPVTARVEKIQPGELGHLEKQGQQEGERQACTDCP